MHAPSNLISYTNDLPISDRHRPSSDLRAFTETCSTTAHNMPDNPGPRKSMERKKKNSALPSRRYREGKHCVGLRRLPEPVRLMPHSFLSLSLMNWQVACYWHDDDNKIKQIKKNNNHDLPSIL